MAFDPEDIDWFEKMRVYGGNTPEAFEKRITKGWVREHCLTACEVAFNECPACKPRLESGALTERMFSYVVCSMVLRVVRWSQRKSESNGAYTRTDDLMQGTPQPGWEESPDLHVTKKERQILEGTPDGNGPIGTLRLGLDRIYGM